MADLTSFQNALKTKYIGPIRDNLYTNTILVDGARIRDGAAGLVA